MLDLIIEGDTHPKTFKLRTDDAQGELNMLQKALDEAEVPPGDPYRSWFDDATPDDFREGVTIPAEHVGEWGEIFESIEDTPAFGEAAAEIDRQREESMKQMETQSAE